MAKKETENKGQKFVRLAKERMPKVIQRLRLIRNLAHPTNYEATKEQAAHLVAVLRAEIDAIEAAFSDPEEGSKSDGFEFPED